MYVEIDDAVYNNFDDELKSQLKVYEPEDTSGLKNKANELLASLRSAQADLSERDAQIKKLKLKPGQTEADDLKAQLDDALAKIEMQEGENQSLRDSITKGKINSEALKLASSLTKDNAKAGLLAEKLSGRLKYENDALTVLSNDGKPTVSSPSDLLGEFKEAYPFLVDGRQSTGGGSIGSDGGAGTSKQATRAQFDAMSHSERSVFSKSGGKVVS